MAWPVRKVAYVAVLIGAAVPLAITGGGFGTAGAVDAVSRLVSDPLSILGARSPGARDDARLVSTKRGHSTPRVEYVLSASEPGPEEAPMALPAAADPFLLPDLATALGEPEPSGLLGMPSAPHYGGSPFFGGTAGPIPGGGGGDGGGGGGGGGDEDNTEPVPGIPEPASWAMMLLGFFAIGHLLRRKRPGIGRARPYPD